jgi:hypothetical protein
MWVIYDRPADFPKAFVARRWVGEKATDDVILATSLGQLRDVMRSKHLTRIDRHKSDDPVIVETWL